MSKKFGIKKIISAALTAASLTGGIVTSSAVSSENTSASSVSALWEMLGEHLKDESVADGLIDVDADTRWIAMCKSAIATLGLQQSQFSNDRGLSLVRGVLTNAIKNECYGKKKVKIWGGLSSEWIVKLNKTQLDNLQAGVLPLLDCYLTTQNIFNPRKDDLNGQERLKDILSGNRLVVQTELANYLQRMNASDLELKNLSASSELALRKMIFDQAYGQPGQPETGLLNLLTQSKSAQTDKTKAMIQRVTEIKKLWEDRIKFLEEKISGEGGNGVDS